MQTLPGFSSWDVIVRGILPLLPVEPNIFIMSTFAVTLNKFVIKSYSKISRGSHVDLPSTKFVDLFLLSNSDFFFGKFNHYYI